MDFKQQSEPSWWGRSGHRHRELTEDRSREEWLGTRRDSRNCGGNTKYTEHLCCGKGNRGPLQIPSGPRGRAGRQMNIRTCSEGRRELRGRHKSCVSLLTASQRAGNALGAPGWKQAGSCPPEQQGLAAAQHLDSQPGEPCSLMAQLSQHGWMSHFPQRQICANPTPRRTSQKQALPWIPRTPPCLKFAPPCPSTIQFSPSSIIVLIMLSGQALSSKRSHSAKKCFQEQHHLRAPFLPVSPAVGYGSWGPGKLILKPPG